MPYSLSRHNDFTFCLIAAALTFAVAAPPVVAQNTTARNGPLPVTQGGRVPVVLADQHDLYDPVQLDQVVREQLRRMDFEDTLAAKVSIDVRRADITGIVKAVRAAGLTARVEVRGTPATPITLAVDDMPAMKVLAVAASFCSSEVFVLQDHLLICPRVFRTAAEAHYADGSENHTLARRAFAFAIASDMIRHDKTHQSLKEFNPLLQQVAQRLEDMALAAAKREHESLAPDTVLVYKPGRDNDMTDFTLTIGEDPPWRGNVFRMLDMTKRRHRLAPQ